MQWNYLPTAEEGAMGLKFSGSFGLPFLYISRMSRMELEQDH